MEWYWWIILGIVGFSIFNHYRQIKLKRQNLIKKYGDARLVDKIMSNMFWQGQTKGQLIDSLGRPQDVDQKVLKTKTKEVWKYKPTGKNRYALKITLEDDEVIGWDQK